MIDLSRLHGFEWDEGNDAKNWNKHEVTQEECEEVFFNQPLLLLPDEAHSQHEVRWYALGRTNKDRLLAVVFTERRDRIRVISARPMSRAERRHYAQENA